MGENELKENNLLKKEGVKGDSKPL